LAGRFGGRGVGAGDASVDGNETAASIPSPLSAGRGAGTSARPETLDGGVAAVTAVGADAPDGSMADRRPNSAGREGRSRAGDPVGTVAAAIFVGTCAIAGAAGRAGLIAARKAAPPTSATAAIAAIIRWVERSFVTK
jgi:hypothetical protein